LIGLEMGMKGKERPGKLTGVAGKTEGKLVLKRAKRSLSSKTNPI